ncbi:transmembrane 220 family protein [Leptospira ellisii]|uniref:Transmembrane 220 family protein n=2 Tax=Leptospira ellisii TaxID=2023197 RepID=A0AAE4QM96_9LEPT|nr:transmembrane 220 family protein [Leptospira ellisii]MDV6235375.1 transmembrane 220 family protein [Leptospira ellisii]
MGARIMKFFSWITILLWLLFAGLQYNDPDPWLWIPIYLSVVLLYLGLLIFPDKTKLLLRTSLVLSAAFSAGTVLAAMQIENLSMDDEVSRETGGLLLSAIWSRIPAYLIRKRENGAVSKG